MVRDIHAEVEVLHILCSRSCRKGFLGVSNTLPYLTLFFFCWNFDLSSKWDLEQGILRPLSVFHGVAFPTAIRTISIGSLLPD